jgi:protein PsiE
MEYNTRNLDKFGRLCVDVFHHIALFAIGATTVWAAGWTFIELFQTKHHASIQDILLLFIYLEIGGMVGIYFKTNHLPVRFLLYIAITALTRHTIDLMSHQPLNIMEMTATGGVTLIVTICVFIVKYTSFHYPNDKKEDIA